jgi:hypothetical protein
LIGSLAATAGFAVGAFAALSRGLQGALIAGLGFIAVPGWSMPFLSCRSSQVRQLRVDFWGLALSGANKINGLMVPLCPNPRSLVVARQSKNTSDLKVP